MSRFIVIKRILINRRQIVGTCWIYTGALRNGYGHISAGIKEFDTQYVHHLAAMLWLGVKREEIGRRKGQHRICHTCNNPACFRPKHLYKGTGRTNNLDAVRAGTLRTFGTDPQWLKKANETMRREPWRRPRGDRHPSRLHPENLSRGDRHWKRRAMHASK